MRSLRVLFVLIVFSCVAAVATPAFGSPLAPLALPASEANAAFAAAFPEAAPFSDAYVDSAERTIAQTSPINLLDYARGDGVTPDGDAINRALQAGSAAGRPVFAPGDHVYLVDRSIRIPTNTILYSNGAVFLGAPSLGGTPVMRNADLERGNDHITLVGFEINANRDARAGTAGAAHGLWLRGGDTSPVHDVFVQNIFVHDSPVMGIAMQNVQDAVFDHVEVARTGRDGFTFYWNSKRIRILAPYVHDAGDDLLGLNSEDDDSNGHRITDVLVWEPRLEDQHGMGSGIAAFGVKRLLVRDAQINRTFSAALDIGNFNATPAEDVVVDGLQSVDAGLSNAGGAGQGIDIESGLDSDRSGAHGVAGVTHVDIRRAVVTRPRANGLILSAGAASPITNVHVQAIVTCSQLYDQGRGVATGTGYVSQLRLDVEVNACPREGIRITGDPGTISDLEIHPQVFDNGMLLASAGVYVLGAHNLTITNGAIGTTCTSASSRQTYGLRLEHISGVGEVRNNTLAANTLSALRLADVVPGITLADNQQQSQCFSRPSASPGSATDDPTPSPSPGRSGITPTRQATGFGVGHSTPAQPSPHPGLGRAVASPSLPTSAPSPPAEVPTHGATWTPLKSLPQLATRRRSRAHKTSLTVRALRKTSLRARLCVTYKRTTRCARTRRLDGSGITLALPPRARKADLSATLTVVTKAAGRSVGQTYRLIDNRWRLA